MVKKFSLAVLLSGCTIIAGAQTKLGGAIGPADVNAYLQLGDPGGTKGLLLSRVNLSATNLPAPLTAHTAGMVVYNTKTAGSGNTAVTPGYYYNDGMQWVRIAGIGNGKSLTSSNGIILSGTPATSLLQDVDMRIDSSAIAKMVPTTMLGDSITSYLNKQITINKVTGQNLSGNGIIVTGGAGTTLKSTSLKLDSTAIAKMVPTTVLGDSITSYLNKQINTNNVNGQNLSGSGIIVTGGTGTTLKSTSLKLDSTVIAKMVPTTVLGDSITSYLNKQINTNKVNGQNLSGNGIIVTGGAGTTLKSTSLKLDSTVIAKMVPTTVLGDSITSYLNKQINTNNVNGQTLSGNGIIVTGGTGTTLKSTSLKLDSTVIAKMVPTTVLGDSITSYLNKQITINKVTGQNLSGNGIIVTGGTGTTLKSTSLKLDSTVIAKMVPTTVLGDSITSYLNKQINVNKVNGQNLSGNGIIVTGGAGTTLKSTSLKLDSTVIAKMVPTTVLGDSITSYLNKQINTNNVTGQNLSGNGIIVTGGTGTTLKSTSLKLDSTVIAKMVPTTVLGDSITSYLNKQITINKVNGNNVTAGSNKVTLGGTPTGAALKPFSIDVNEANLNLNNIGGTLNLNKINNGGATNNQTLVWNGTTNSWTPQTPAADWLKSGTTSTSAVNTDAQYATGNIGLGGHTGGAADNTYNFANNIPNAPLVVVAPGNADPGSAAVAATAIRMGMPGTNGSKWPLSADLKVGSYSTGLSAHTQLDVMLGNGNTSTPDATVASFLGNGNVGIGTTTPGTRLEVAGQVKITGGSPAQDKVLTSDNLGLATWQPATVTSNNVTNANNVTAGSNKVALGGTPTGATLKPFSIDINEANLNLNNIGGTLNLNKISSAGATNNQTLIWNSNTNTWTPGNPAVDGDAWGVNGEDQTSNIKRTGEVRVGTGANGAIVLTQGGAANSGHLQIYKADGTTRQGYIGWDNTNLTYITENGANHVFDGGNVGIGNTNPVLNIDTKNSSVIGTSATSVGGHDPSNTGTKVSFGAVVNTDPSEFAGMKVVNAVGTNGCGNTSDVLFNTWECNTSSSREVMRINGTGNVGIGTATPGAKLEVAGQVKITGGSPAQGNVLTSDNLGLATWQPATVTSNNVTNANNVTAGSNKVALGGTPTGATLKPFTIDVNEANLNLNNIGGTLNLNKINNGGAANNQTLIWNSTTNTWTPGNPVGDGDAWGMDGEDQTSDIGRNGKVVIGGQAGSAQALLDVRGDAHINSMTVGRGGGNISSNVAVGIRVLRNNTASGSFNTAIGMFALEHNTTGSVNQALGSSALTNNTTGSYNIALGTNALHDNTTGQSNVALGYLALTTMVSGANNIAIGTDAIGNNTVGQDNIGIGTAAGSGTSGNSNVIIGSGAYIATNAGAGSNNIVIGTNAQPSNSSVSNEVTLGNANNSVYRMFASSWTNASDRRLKHDIGDIPVGLSFVEKLHPVKYVYNNAKDGEVSLGFIAQEVQELAKQYPSLNNSGLVSVIDKENGTLGLKTTDLIPVLTKAIQEQQAKITADEVTIKELKTEIEAIKALLQKK